PNKTNNKSQYSYVTLPSINCNAITIEVIATLNIIMTPPIVGVPDLARCDWGPSSRTLCPNFNFLRNGINIGLIRTVIKKLIAIDIITTYKLILSSSSFYYNRPNLFYYKSFHSFFIDIFSLH